MPFYFNDGEFGHSKLQLFGEGLLTNWLSIIPADTTNGEGIVSGFPIESMGVLGGQVRGIYNRLSVSSY